MHKEHVYIGLGSNLGDSGALLEAACSEMAALTQTRLLARSSVYGSSPMGPQDQPDYLNAVCLLETSLEPLALLHQLQRIEKEHGRERKAERWGPRTLDLDILLYGNVEMHTEELTLPHYGMAEREFVMVPLFEIAPSMIMPDGNPIALWVSRCNLDGLRRLTPSTQA